MRDLAAQSGGTFTKRAARAKGRGEPWLPWAEAALLPGLSEPFCPEVLMDAIERCRRVEPAAMPDGAA